jgi:hypothetical protein
MVCDEVLQRIMILWRGFKNAIAHDVGCSIYSQHRVVAYQIVVPATLRSSFFRFRFFSRPDPAAVSGIWDVTAFPILELSHAG